MKWESSTNQELSHSEVEVLNTKTVNGPIFPELEQEGTWSGIIYVWR